MKLLELRQVDHDAKHGGAPAIGRCRTASRRRQRRYRRRGMLDATKPVLAARPDAAGKTVRSVLESPVTPVVLDAFRQTARGADVTLVLGFAGTREEVAWQSKEAAGLGFVTPSSLEHESAFWNVRSAVQSISVLPTKVADIIADLGGRDFVARAGNGIIHCRN